MSSWKGIDPLLRALRVIAIVSFLVLLAIITIDPERQDASLEFLLVGSILIALGYNAVVRMPEFFQSTHDDDDPDTTSPDEDVPHD